jgi:eukaryotic-like serine/threonine-protein kinase
MRACLSEDEILDLLSGELGEDPEVHAHLAECTDCAALVAVSAQPIATSGSALASGSALSGVGIGRYRIRGLVGCGGYGAVYRCADPDLNRVVAVKVQRIDAECGPELVHRLRARLLDEARILAGVVHPNIVSIFDVGTFEGQPYFVMEHVDGGTLRQWLRSRDRGWRPILRTFLAAGRGLQAAHSRGIVHRDFKPDNVLVSNDGRILVSDFGFSAFREAGPAPPRSVAGTPAYMAPEQALGLDVDGRADQYAFCVSLDEALRGSQNLDRAARLPQRLRRILARGRSERPGDRFPSMEPLLSALERVLAARRRRAVALAAVAAALAGAALTFALKPSPSALPECSAAAVGFAGEWDPKVKEHLRSTLLTAGATASVVDATLRDLDGYTAAWTATQVAACTRAVAAKGDETSLLELTCLRRERSELEALLPVLLSGDQDIAPSASLAVASRVPPMRCVDERTLAWLPKPPADPIARQEVEGLRLRLASLEVEAIAGKAKPAVERIRAIVARAHELRFTPLEAEAFVALSLAQAYASEHRSAIDTLREAANLAESSAYGAIAAQTEAALANEFAEEGQVSEAHRWLTRARASVEAIGGDDYCQALLAGGESKLAHSAQEAVDDSRRASTLMTKALGPTHPRALVYRLNLVLAECSAGLYAETIQEAAVLLPELESALGEDRYQIYALASECEALRALGRFAESEQALTRADALLSRFPAADDAYRVNLEFASLLLEEGQVAPALGRAQLASEAAASQRGEDSLPYGAALSVQGRLLLLAGKAKEAKPLLERSLDILARSGGSQSTNHVDALTALASAEIALRDSARAVPLAERALAIALETRPYPGELARVRFTLARALTGTKQDPVRVAELARQARNELKTLGWRKAELATLEAWITQNRIR